MSSGLDSKLNLLWKCYDLEKESSLKFSYFSPGGEKTLKIVTIEIQHCCSDSWLLSRPVTDNEDDCDWIIFILESKTLGLLKGLIEESETLLYPCNVRWLSWSSSHSPAPAKGRWCVDTDGFCPFWWSCEFAWATHPSAGLLSRAALGVPGRPRCQEALWKRSKAVMQVWNPMGSQEGEQGTEQPWADVQHFALVIGFGHSNSTGRMGQGSGCRRVPGLPKNPEGTTWGCCQGRVYCPWGTQKYSSNRPLVDAHFSPEETVWAENVSFPLPSVSLRCWHSAAETWSNQCSYGEVCLAWKMILWNRSIKFVSVFADNFHEYITLKYGTSMLTYSLWCLKWLEKNPSVIW